mmetsp:Transcript_40270/g.80723  ORF Transcript_40270/g.80723 Transcript_40270/m.80723 type:complete len:205 (-) Transcript_40270:378-992(-)|eukprot:CAMPEP_0174711228 /NCGR_PEP_ID=MMETSP1094-20130205/12616_1 /TAXON_ID=156173 /ORGANISM="Chrysochromulina brevifilum, Strain UTEX LB 985" /LENGTH=204 /DNA_ID=CAMNT_0015910135 /DNA_START=77 /DNA_END=691 /DNA_ORIENTATION=-
MSRLLLVGLVLVAAEELKVTQYDGPTECGDEDKVKVGDQLGMHYTGTIDESSKTGIKGKQFDSSRGRDVFDTQIGVGQVIKGWDEGIVGLCKGAKAILIIPPEMGYGVQGAGGDIPGGATLRFDVEVVSINRGGREPNLFESLDVDKDGMLSPEEVLAHFQKHDPNAELPEGLMESEDKDKDGIISWSEFSGPKGTSPPTKEEL